MGVNPRGLDVRRSVGGRLRAQTRLPRSGAILRIGSEPSSVSSHAIILPPCGRYRGKVWSGERGSARENAVSRCRLVVRTPGADWLCRRTDVRDQRLQSGEAPFPSRLGRTYRRSVRGCAQTTHHPGVSRESIGRARWEKPLRTSSRALVDLLFPRDGRRVPRDNPGGSCSVRGNQGRVADAWRWDRRRGSTRVR